MKKLIKPSDLREQAKALLDAGKMPSLEAVLSAVADARTRYRDQILAARRSK